MGLDKRGEVGQHVERGGKGVSGIWMLWGGDVGREGDGEGESCIKEELEGRYGVGKHR